MANFLSRVLRIVADALLDAFSSDSGRASNRSKTRARGSAGKAARGGRAGSSGSRPGGSARSGGAGGSGARSGSGAGASGAGGSGAGGSGAGASGARSGSSRGGAPKPGPARVPSPPSATGHGGQVQELKQLPKFQYAPHRDGDADPGEVVWAWVPYEDDPSQGKDRPVLVLGRVGAHLAVVTLTSKDHGRGGGQRGNRVYVDVGTGAWDPQGRPSEARVDRVIALAPAAVRREGASLDRDTFERVAHAVASLH